MTQAFDVAVVGAGPAGSAAAYHLAAAGWRVILLERSAFPREKACGDGVSPGAMMLLDEMGLGRELNRHRQITGVRVITGSNGHRDSLFGPGHPRGPAGIVIPRRELDQLVASRAVEAGAVLWQNAPVRGPLWANGRVAGVRVAQASAEITIPASFVIAADGALSPFAAKAGLLTRDRGATGYAARAYAAGMTGLESLFHCYVPLVDPATNRRISGYGWVFPLGEGRANIGVGFSPVSARDRRVNLRRVFEMFVTRLRDTDNRFRDMQPDRCQGAPLFHGVDAARCAGRNTLLVGDAAGLVDPVTGEGIDRALESGKLAATVLRSALASTHPERADLGEYCRLLETQFGARARSRRKLTQMHRFVSALVEHTLTIDTPLFESVRREVIGYTEGESSASPSVAAGRPERNGVFDAAAVRERVIATIDAELPLLSGLYADFVSFEDTSIKTELASLAARCGQATATTLIAATTSIELAQLPVAVHCHLSRTGAGHVTRTGSRESVQWSTMFPVMAGDYLLTRAHALASMLGPRIGAAVGRAVAGAYLSLMQEFRGNMDPAAAEARRPVAAIEKRIAIFHELPCRLAGIAAGVPDAVVEILAEYGRHLGIALALTKEARGGARTAIEAHHALRASCACLDRLPSGASRHSLEMVTSAVERRFAFDTTVPDVSMHHSIS